MNGLAANMLDHKAFGRVAESVLKRRFDKRAKLRVLIYREPGDIARSQIEPFFYHASAFADRLGADFRCLPVAEFLTESRGPDADVVLVQPWFTVPPEKLVSAFRALRRRLPAARLVFLDCYAHNDLRLGQYVDPYIDYYYKKSVFRDRSQYLVPRVGDTNLTEFYGNLYGLDQGAAVDWNAPESILPKLRLSPNFFTQRRFFEAFRHGEPPEMAGRSIDVQSRLGHKGSAWYSAMRKDAQSKLEQIAGLSLSPPGRLDRKAFMAELSKAKLCFSPFGYGELCWRDVEAFQTGAILIKPDMGHLLTRPDLYEAGITYLPVRWDFSDLEEVVCEALENDEKRRKIANEAWRRTAQYIRTERFVDDMSEMLIGVA